MTTNKCEGCHTYINAGFRCSTRLIKQSDRCPCIICLIKVVCKKACDEYRKFCRYGGPRLK